MHRALVLGLWLLATVLAVCVGWYGYAAATGAGLPTGQVLDRPDAAAAQRLLDQVADRADALVDRLPHGAIKTRLRQRWDRRRLYEGAFRHERLTSYTINKGERVVLCLRQPDAQFHDLDLLVYVLLHEKKPLSNEPHAFGSKKGLL